MLEIRRETALMPDRLTVALRGHHLRCKQPGFAQREVEALTSNRVEGMRGIADQQITRSVLFGCGEAHQRPLAALTHRHHAAKSPAKSVLKRSYECRVIQPAECRDLLIGNRPHHVKSLRRATNRR